MPATDDLDLIRELVAEPGPSAILTERGRQQLDALTSAESARQRSARPTWTGFPKSPRTSWTPARKRLVVAAAGLSAVAVAATILGSAGQSTGQIGPRVSAGVLPTAQQVLLTAAEHAATAPATAGTYWRVDDIEAQLLPAGTLAHPYDIFAMQRQDVWTAKAVGKRSWYIWQELPVSLATPADAAAWRAAGSPSRWIFGAGAKTQTDTLSAQASAASMSVSDGTVGYIEGDEGSLTAAQFAALPDTTGGLKALLVGYAKKTWSAQHPGGGGATVDQLVWGEAVALLTDPVTPQVRAAAFKVMAGLPGVRSLGRMHDLLGRTGYGLGLGPSTSSSVGKQIALIDPNGVFLGTALVGHPDPAMCNQPGATCHAYYGRHSFSAMAPIRWLLVVKAGWTSSRPPLPPVSARVHR
jgi:hypothetical protein